jgi:23S rRNA (uracil1939-C5)-methyltransferase
LPGTVSARDRVVFVPRVLTGERVEAVVTRVTSRFARAECRRILAPSPARVAPACPHYGACGGCCYQQAAYPLQLQLKQKQVADILQRIGGLTAPVEPVAASPLAYGYRNKLTLHGPGQPAMQRAAGGGLLPVAHCALAGDGINRRLAEVTELRLKPGEDLVIRGNAAGEVFTYRESSRRQSSERAAPAIIEETLAGKKFQVPLRSFFQVNHAVHELLLARLARFGEEEPDLNLVDAYCGAGIFALALAGHAKRVFGIEADPAAAACAAGNAAALGITNARFQRGRVEDRLRPALRESGAERTCAILDPPRAGCDARVLDVLQRERPRRILYLACVPPVLARDLKALCAGGYEVRRIVPFDMFPQTAHVEVLAELSFSRG